MKLLDLFKKTKEIKKPSKFSNFFLHASENKKEEVFKEAARKANEEQREVFARSLLKVKID
jgi:hypothetical protein